MRKNPGHDKRRLADMTIQPADAADEAPWEPPPEEECHEHTTRWSLGTQGEIIMQRLLFDRSDRIVDFAVMQMTRHGGHMRQVVRVGC